MNQITRSIIFPESSALLVKRSSSKRVTFKYLVVVLYLYGGLHGLVWLLSKTVLMPMFRQLVQDRIEYHQTFLDQLQKFTARVSGMVSYMPAAAVLTWENAQGSRYSDAQTQTEESDESKDAGSDRYFYNTVTSTVRPHKGQRGSQVRFNRSEKEEEDAESLPDVRTLAEKADERAGVFTESVKQLASTVTMLENGTIMGYADPFKYQLDNMATYISNIPTARSPQYVGMQPVGGDKPNAVEQVKKEIRSFKGSFLSARNFAPIRR